MVDVAITFEGWGNDEWGDGGWGEGNYEDGHLTASINDVLAKLDVAISETGFGLVASMNGVETFGTANVFPTGFLADAEQGIGMVFTGTFLYATGVQGTTTVGEELIKIDVRPAVTGLLATTFIDGVSITTQQILSVSGQVLTGTVGNVSFITDQNIFIPTGLLAEPSIGVNGFVLDQNLTMTGIEAITYINNVTAFSWYPIIPPDGNWTPVDPVGGDNWTPISVGPSTWTRV